MNNFKKLCGCFSLRRATSLFQLLIVVVILGLCSIVLTVNRILMDSMISEMADLLLFKQSFSQNEIQTNLFKHQANWPLSKGFRTLSDLNYIYQELMPTLNINSFEEPLICPPYNGTPFDEANNTLLKLPEFCMYYQDQINAQNSQAFSLYFNLLNSLLLPISMDSDAIYLTNVDTDFLFASCPPIFNYPKYNPHLRPWFTNHMEQAEATGGSAFVSNMYQSYEADVYSFTLTQSLLSQKQIIDGVVGYDLSFGVYSSLLQQKQFVYFIVNTLGQIVSTNQEEQLSINLTNQTVNIYEQNITGFNEKDWIQIRNSVLNLSFINSCSIQIDHLCRFNEKFHLDIILHTLNIQSDFYLIMQPIMQFRFQNITIQQENIARAEASQLEVLKAFSKVLSYMVFTSIFLLLCTWIGMFLFFRPFNKMQQILNTQIRSKFASPNWQQKMYKACDDKRNSYLNQALKILRTKISDINNKKCLNCHLVENFKYPKKLLFLEFFEIKKQLKNLSESRFNNLLFKFGNQILQTGSINDTNNQAHETINSPVNVNFQTIQSSIASEGDENDKLLGKKDTFRYFIY